MESMVGKSLEEFLSDDSVVNHAEKQDAGGQGEGSSTCERCKRGLTNQVSRSRGLGPVCYGKSGGGVFDKDLEADEKEWERRREHLMLAKAEGEPYGPEIDLGVNWRVYRDGYLPLSIGIAIRYNFDTENFEAYGRINHLSADDPNFETVYYSGKDLKEAYRAGVAAGPKEQANCDRAVRSARRRGRR